MRFDSDLTQISGPKNGGWSLWPKLQILGEKRPVSKNNKIIKRIDFEMGPSVKFVSPNRGLISKKKNGGQFFSGKVTIQGGGGGVQGGFGKRP